MTVYLAVSVAAFAVALIAVGLAAWLIYATRDARETAHRHERRRREDGPPPGQPERRHRSPDDTRARRRDEDDPQWTVERVDDPYIVRTDRPQDVRANDPATYPPRPAPRHRTPDAPPTADMRTLPPPGSINR